MFENLGPMYIIGQSLSFVAVIIGFISYQMKSSSSILAMEVVSALVFASHYLLIGAPTAMALNLLAALQCFVYYLRAKRGGKSIIVPIIFTCLVITTSILTWNGWYSVFIMAGLAVHSFFMASSNPQTIRYAIFFKAPACLTYNIIVFSLGGILYECSVFISSIISTIKYYRKKRRYSLAQTEAKNVKV